MDRADQLIFQIGITLGLLNGFAIVALAILFDCASQAYAKRTQAHLGNLKHD